MEWLHVDLHVQPDLYNFTALDWSQLVRQPVQSFQKPRHHSQQLAPTLPHDESRSLQQEFRLLNEFENHLGPVTRTQYAGRMIDADYSNCLTN
jgi:hypothetical protein